MAKRVWRQRSMARMAISSRGSVAKLSRSNRIRRSLSPTRPTPCVLDIPRSQRRRANCVSNSVRSSASIYSLWAARSEKNWTLPIRLTRLRMSLDLSALAEEYEDLSMEQDESGEEDGADVWQRSKSLPTISAM